MLKCLVTDGFTSKDFSWEKMAHIRLIFKDFFLPKLPYFYDKLAKNIKGLCFKNKLSL
jgi:hypothetical protein